MGARGKPDPLYRSNALGRTVSAGLVGLVITASTFLGAGIANAADPLLVDQPLATVNAVPGQQITIAPSTLDFKVREAVLLAMPLAFGPAADAAERFKELTPISLGTAPEGRTFYSGKDIAKAAAPRLAEIGLPADKVDAVTWYFTNLVSLGNALTVKAERPEEQPPPSSGQPTPGKSKPPTPEPSATQPPSPTTPPPVVTTPEPTLTPSIGAPAEISVLPPSLRDLQGGSPPWGQARYGQVPGPTPNVGDLAKQAQEQQKAREQQEEIRAAGRAEALPTEVTERVAAPVLLAAISLAVVTAALVRSWVLRRN
ncbi:hypothetical protein [Saccharopolyspora sp. ASAGF58]|uniref:hypothetical protein n=1 Tax=Saccharopolyspora sp. ASAGF58 TaxID=2719023 RepID=UPI00143FDE36|nr:hypothetical protein [Saccharopolyspora sp. ASAGF58]QIZ35168.1 hypothetical protein FDZ84_11125 [Saccharopolyspora sp. ASAGF58]